MFKSLRSRRVQGLTRSALFAVLAALFLPLPLFAQAPATHHHYKLVDLGTLPEGGYESGAQAVNSRGQAVGCATNTVPL